MTRKLAALVLAASAWFSAGQARAQTALPGADLSTGLTFGTLGVGAELEARLRDLPFGFRADVSGLAFDGHDMFAHRVQMQAPPYGIDARLAYDAKFRLLTGGVTADWYVFGDFRISAGLLGNGNAVDSRLRPTGTVQVGPYSFPVASLVSASGHAGWNALAPFLGLGYETRVLPSVLSGGLRLSVELGAYYEGHPHSSVSVSGPGADVPLMQSLMEEERRRVTNGIDYPFYPVAQIGLSWRF